MLKSSAVVLLNRFIVATLIIVLAGIYFIDVQSLPNVRDKVLISPIFWIMLVFYPIILWQEWRTWKAKERAQQNKATNTKEEPEADEVEGKLSKKIVLFMGSIALYLALITSIGFVILTPVFLFALMYILGTRSWKVLLSVSLITTVLLYIFFVIWLGIPLPQGIGF
ncbi:tripartite tricarboxylate transporter TctB family protein [Bacillus horti]|uniref:Cytoskeletal protein RodZ n=1 Tax=Caldalkalibacillus horti TaxID=77523 RepID=A0ABT9VTQ0_9BACI|nr:tripartite tricarboxylate transporter TctB family protein [Bacillus horti]MDQ0164364.1 cytoskeletal protein RodZ [Bacillus horti]